VQCHAAGANSVVALVKRAHTQTLLFDNSSTMVGAKKRLELVLDSGSTFWEVSVKVRRMHSDEPPNPLHRMHHPCPAAPFRARNRGGTHSVRLRSRAPGPLPQGRIVSTRWGAFGTDGRGRDEDFPCHLRALRESDRLVQQKQRAGYSETAKASSAALGFAQVREESTLPPHPPGRSPRAGARCQSPRTDGRNCNTLCRANCPIANWAIGARLRVGFVAARGLRDGRATRLPPAEGGSVNRLPRRRPERLQRDADADADSAAGEPDRGGTVHHWLSDPVHQIAEVRHASHSPRG
jgi:predicted DNA-binding WGR domain protein